MFAKYVLIQTALVSQTIGEKLFRQSFNLYNKRQALLNTSLLMDVCVQLSKVEIPQGIHSSAVLCLLLPSQKVNVILPCYNLSLLFLLLPDTLLKCKLFLFSFQSYTPI